MPIRRRIDKRREDITEEQEAWLNGDDKGAVFFKFLPDDELLAFWNLHSERIVAEHVARYPGSRPVRWWDYDAPRLPLGTYPGCYWDGELSEPRKRIGGVGTPGHDVLAYVPLFDYGLPVIWITPWQVRYYSGTAVDVHGNPIGSRNPNKNFKGVAIDPDDPPIFESQATYLKRHRLFLAGEERRLKKSDFEPEAIQPD